MGDKEATLPKATLTKMIKELLPDSVRCSAEARDLVIACCLEFVNMVTQESLDVADKSKKKTISPEHVIQALEQLEFHDYVGDVTSVYEAHKSATAKTNERNRKRKVKQMDMTPEEAAEQQRLLFDSARTRYDQAHDQNAVVET